MSKMPSSEGVLFSDADQICRRTHDHILSLRESRMRTSMERKLVVHQSPTFSFSLLLLFSLFLLSIQFPLCAADAQSSFRIVVFFCVWKRPLLTEFVLSHFNNLKHSLAVDHIQLDLFLTGSDAVETESLSKKFSAAYSVHPNSPLGAKHDSGIQSLRDHYVSTSKEQSLPDAVTIFGSDDVVNKQFFVLVRDLMRNRFPKSHIVGLRDLYFHDLKNNKLVYTKGYRSFRLPISGTLGCGRVYSWAILNDLDWHLWDVERERGLDQSAVRNVMSRMPLIGDISTAVAGKDHGIVAVDLKSDGYASGTNIWKFEEVVDAVGRNGRLHDFQEIEAENVLGKAFGEQFLISVEALRERMARSAE